MDYKSNWIYDHLKKLLLNLKNKYMKSLYGELCQIDIAKCVNEVVDMVLPRGTKDKVLIVSLKLQAENFDTEHNVRDNISIVFYRPSNYTFVGEPVNPETKLSPCLNDGEEITRYSYHDSCWRSDGTEHLVRKHATVVQNKCKNGGKDYSVYTSFGLVPFKLIDGKIDIQDSDKRSKFIV
jgi:hypothetical protein